MPPPPPPLRPLRLHPSSCTPPPQTCRANLPFELAPTSGARPRPPALPQPATSQVRLSASRLSLQAALPDAPLVGVAHLPPRLQLHRRRVLRQRVPGTSCLGQARGLCFRLPTGCAFAAILRATTPQPMLACACGPGHGLALVTSVTHDIRHYITYVTPCILRAWARTRGRRCRATTGASLSYRSLSSSCRAPTSCGCSTCPTGFSVTARDASARATASRWATTSPPASSPTGYVASPRIATRVNQHAIPPLAFQLRTTPLRCA